MTKKVNYPANSVGNFFIGELFPLKNCYLRVAYIEQGVLVLTLDGFTARGQQIVAELKEKYQADLIKQEINEQSNSNETETPEAG